jgi:hypothetical protein
VTALPEPVRSVVDESAGAGLGVAASLGPDGDALANTVRLAFGEGVSAAMWIGATVLAVTAVLCAVFGPRRAANAPVATEVEVIDAH